MHQEKQKPEMLVLDGCEDDAFLHKYSAPSLQSTRPPTPASAAGLSTRPPTPASSAVSPTSRSSVTEMQPPSRRSSLRKLQLASLLHSSSGTTLPKAPDVVAPASSLLRPPLGLETFYMPPPGLDRTSCVVSQIPHACVQEVAEQSSDMQMFVESRNMELPFSVTTSSVNGIATSQILWRISNPQSKFKSSCGCAMVSQSFNAGGLSDLRLLFAPGRQWTAEQAQKHKGKKNYWKFDKDRNRLAELLPSNGSLQLKFGGETCATEEVQLYFCVGSMQLGPYSASPWTCTSQAYELPSDWRKEVTASGIIVVGLEIVDR